MEKPDLPFVGDRINKIIHHFDRDFYGYERKLSLLLQWILALDIESKDKFVKLTCDLCGLLKPKDCLSFSL